MRAAILEATDSPLRILQRDDPEPNAGEVVVAVRAAGLNRRDFWITQGMYPGLKLPAVLGSDAAGVITAIGAGVDPAWLDAEVIINPGLRWGDDERVQSAEFEILGMPADGTFATHVVVPASQLARKPEHLAWEEAAALPLAGVTAYRALFSRGQLTESERVLVTGAGGGVASFALLFAVAHGAEVIVTSSSPEKIARAVELGAAGGVLYTDDDWGQQVASRFGRPHLVIDGAGGPSYGQLLKLMAPGGRIVHYGATAGPPDSVDLFQIFWKQISVLGSTMGSPADFAAMLEFVSTNGLRPVVEEVLPLNEVNRALSLMRSSPQLGNYVLDCAADASS